MLRCEYCRVSYSNVGQVRRHILTIEHTRNRERCHLSKDNCIQAISQMHNKPRNFCQLMSLLSLQSPRDIVALEDAGFFNIETDQQAEVARTLITVIDEAITKCHIESLPKDLRGKLVEAYKKHSKS